MHIKFLGHGQGSAKRATDYVTAAHDSLGLERGRVETLRGDPDATAAVADGLEFKHRYRSAVIAWAPEDQPTDEQIAGVLDDFERLAFAGLSPERYSWTAVRHDDSHGTHVHVIAARVDLETGKSLNPAPPGWQRDFDPLRDYWNAEAGWAEPGDPARARLSQPGHEALKDAAEIRAGLHPSSAKRQVTEWLTQRVEAGLVTDRDDVRASLSELGEITREGEQYISVKPEGFQQAIRLKGAIYERQFTPERLEPEQAAAREAAAGSGLDRSGEPGRAAPARAELESAIKRRAQYNEARYPAQAAGDRARAEAAAEPDQRADRELARGPAPGGSATEVADEAAADHASVSLPGELRRDLGLVEGAEPVDGRDDEHAERASRLPGTEGHGVDPVPDQQPGQSAVQAGPIQRLKERLGAIYDRARAAVVERVRSAIDAVRAGAEAAAGSDRALATAGGDLEQASDRADHAVRAVGRSAEQAIGDLAMKREQELERFKTDINLSEFAASKGYELDRRESSQASHVMRRGDDKIVIATDEDRHGIYFDAHSPGNSGSVIDFAQRETGANLGAVRKELRPWVGAEAQPVPQAQRIARPEPSTPDRQQVIARYAGMQETPAQGHSYLLERGISAQTQQEPRFRGTVRADDRGNAIFPHYDEAGLSGFEAKNQEFTGFSKGGQKALWHSANLENASRVVVVESAIDAMSHAQVTGERDAAYISIGGQMSEHQREQLRSTLEAAHERGAQIEIATDNDEAGERLGQQIRADKPAGAQLQQRTPSVGVDWNDQAQARQRAEAERQRAEAERQREGPQMGG
jgi:hypothetical protein